MKIKQRKIYQQFYVLFVFSMLFLAGGRIGVVHAVSMEKMVITDTSVLEELPLPSVPSTLRTAPERAAYVLTHFWDSMDFRDMLHCRNKAFLEQNFVNFVSLFPHASQEACALAVKRLMKAAETDTVVYALLAEMAEKYLYEPESPMRCEECFQLFLEEMVHTPVLDEFAKVRPVYLLGIMKKNCPGMRAADFTYRLPDGKRQTLYDTPGEWLLLLFYDPTCEHCHEVMAELKEDDCLQKLTNAGQLTILVVDAGGDRVVWERMLPVLPAIWHPALGEERVQELYPWRSLPALYLLDRNKNVLLKETSLQTITDFF